MSHIAIVIFLVLFAASSFMMLLIIHVERMKSTNEAIEVVWNEYITVQLYAFLSFFGTQSFERALIHGRTFKILSCFGLAVLFGSLSLGTIIRNLIECYTCNLLASLIEGGFGLLLFYENIRLYRKITAKFADLSKI